MTRKKSRYRKAQIGFGEFIEKQTNKRARTAPFYPRGHGLKNCAEVRQLERENCWITLRRRTQKITLKKLLARIELCARRANSGPSVPKCRSATLNPAQTEEGAHIIGDATDAVVGKHWEDSDLSGNDVTKNRLDRLDKLLNTATTGNAQKFDPALYDELTANIRSQMGSLDPAANERV